MAAIAGVEELRARYPAPHHPVGEENAFGQLATAYDLLGESQRAIAALDSAIRITRASDLPVQEAENLKLLAEIYERTGDRRRAQAHGPRLRWPRTPPRPTGCDWPSF